MIHLNCEKINFQLFMRTKLFLSLYLISLTFYSQASSKQVSDGFLPNEIPLKVLYTKNSNVSYILTQQNVYLLSNKKMTVFYTSTEPIHCGFVNDSSIWLGNENGITVLKRKDKQTTKINIEPNVKSYKVVSIVEKQDHTLLIATDAYGLYKYSKSKPAEKVNTMFPINKGVVTSDSSIWIGTDAGLFRNKKDEWTRYNEEGVANFEIPDNIVQNLIVDDFGFLWVIMRNGISVIDVVQRKEDRDHKHNEEMHAHLPSVEFIGDRENMITDLSYFKGKGYVFATDMGLLWMPIKSDEELLENFHHGHSEKVENKELLIKINTVDINTQIGKVLFIAKTNGVTIFVGEKGIHEVNSKELNKLLISNKLN